MTIQELILITENKLSTLHTNLSSYQINGEIELYEKTKFDIAETELTLEKLRNV